MQGSRHSLGLRSWRRALLLVPLFVFCYSTYGQAQDVADAARQQRERKTEQNQKAPHVYTDEDLKRDKILTPDDQAKVATRKKQKTSAPNSPKNAETLPSPSAPTEPTESLGEVARRYRKEREATEAQEAARKKITPFPYSAPQPAFAVPQPEIAPLVRTSPEAQVRRPREISPLVRPHIPSSANSSRVRISPFQPRPMLAAPTAPLGLAAPSAAATPSVAPIAPHTIPRSDRSLMTNTTSATETSGLRQIQVQRGDSWWKLAGQYLGSGACWRELRNMNLDVSEPTESLRAGSLIRVPESASVRSLSAGSEIVVQRGDTLWAIARMHLGHGSSWTCLASANPQLTGSTRLTTGSVLHLPDGESLRACERAIPRLSSR